MSKSTFPSAETKGRTSALALLIGAIENVRTVAVMMAKKMKIWAERQMGFTI
jgi:hypothetical protein